MMTMDWLRVYLAGLFLVPLISATNSTTQRTSAVTEVQNFSTSSEPTTADKGSSTLVSRIPANISMTPSPSARGNATTPEAMHPATTSSYSQQPNNTTILVQSTSSPAGTVGIVTASTIAGYIFLVIIVIALAVLCWILISLRRKSRWYSFDFKYPVLLTDPPGTFETVNMDGLNIVDLSPLPASNGERLLDQEVLLPYSGFLPLDTEQTDRKWDQSDGVSLHITEEEPENSTALSCGSTAP
ncbi:uncharacterized protein LOC132445571 [Gadus macrocephalus]|uniref:uncharacterized protein LOC132445571 n=1 Tax=Gadus macrocephalus TaxID=80720 RepID=UPI0028CB8CCF|nr:uncharacterized protein LOC132445571 [Gadus macrocephalus]XP_059891624.1 uncharacterized protein LOC132445571 [Gadus macrocephalus]